MRPSFEQDIAPTDAPPLPAVQSLVVNGRYGRDTAFQTILFSRTHDFAFDGRDGRLATRQFRLGSGSIRVGRVASTGHRITLSEDADATLLFPRAGALGLRIAGNHHDLPGGTVALMPPQHRQTHAGAGPRGAFLGDVLMIPSADLSQLAERVGASPPPARDFTRLAGPATLRLARLIGEILRGPTGGDTLMAAPCQNALASLIGDALAEVIAEHPADNTTGSRHGAGLEYIRVRRAEAYIRAHAGDPISTAELARDLDIGLRSLQLAFQRVCGESPRAYINRVRLDLAHARLLLADRDRETVTSIALDCGFTHFGRFAGTYAQRFGQTPSQTLHALYHA